MLEECGRLHKMVLHVVRSDEVCRRFMSVPGVGPIVALSFKTAIDAPARFSRSRTVGAYLGMTPRRYQSGEIDRTGRISKIGDRAVRTALFEAASVLLTRVSRWSALKAWGVRIAHRSGVEDRQGRIDVWTGHHAAAPQIIGRAICCLARHHHRDADPVSGRFLFAGYAFEWHLRTTSATPVLDLEIVEDVLHNLR
jgi:hypothetical protein